MLYFIPGSSGSGKSAVIPHLKEKLPDMIVEDFDTHPIQERIGIMDTTEKRQQVAEAWLQTALDNQPQYMIVSGLGVMGEVLACPSASQLDHIAFCLLDCQDLQRLDRIRQRGDVENASMEILCWAAWLRVHHVDPQFRQDVINTGKMPNMRWERWARWERGHADWRCHYIDTTDMALDTVADKIVTWIRYEETLYNGGYRLHLD